VPAGRLSKYAVLVLAFAVGSVCAVSPLLAKKLLSERKTIENAPATAADQKRALHALNRLAFGPRPGDVQRVLDMGVDNWISLQLHPEKIDDNALDARLEDFQTLRMSSRELAENFPDNQLINQVRNGKRPMPSDPALRMVYQVQIAKFEQKKELKEAKAANAVAVSGDDSTKPASTMPPGDSAASAIQPIASDGNESLAVAAPPSKLAPEDSEETRRHEEQRQSDLEVQRLIGLAPDDRFDAILNLPLDEKLALANVRGGKAQDLLTGLNPKQKETLLSVNYPTGVVTGELMQAKLLRAIYSERQLDEVMTDFWFNHFNVFAEKGLDKLFVTSYERDVIRPHALGKFEDLLVAAAQSPAMLFYLDNFLSVGPNSDQALGIPAKAPGSRGSQKPYPARPNKSKRPSGLNENYGRELLELHTLSVNGGYSQHDVTEAAKVFTGWTIDKPAEGGCFKFDPRMHEPGPKVVLGHKIKPKGEAEGLELLHRLAMSPKTAHFISLKLAERFVSDDPPPALVDRMAKTFLKKKGDIREVLTVLFRSPEFWDDGTYRAKVKTPLEFVASAARATGAEIADAQPLARQLNNMGMPLYGAQPPTGYSMKAETWVSSSALLTRMNFALALVNGKIKGVKVDLTPLAGNAPSTYPPQNSGATLSALENSLLEGDVSGQTNDSIAAQQKSDSKTIAGLLIGSPEFQRR
jgi:Protein of unknown function (DUF1800)